MKRDRDGSELEAPEDVPISPAHYCDDGWIGHDEVGRPRHCRVCRPWIDNSRQALRQRLYGPVAPRPHGSAP